MSAEFSLIPPFEKIPPVRIAFNIGALFDIATGEILMGQYGESIVNGGVHSFTAIVGAPNTFKTLLGDYHMVVPLSRFPEATGLTYDTETNIGYGRKRQLAENIPELSGDNNPVDSNRWSLTDNTRYLGNEYYEELKKFNKSKIANQKSLLRTTPFLDRGMNLYKTMVPTFNMIDSLTEFKISETVEIMDENEIGDSKQNAVVLRQNNAKSKFLSELPRFLSNTVSPMIMTAHVGKQVQIDPRSPPAKKLQFLKNGDVVKGVSDNFLFLTNNSWQCMSGVPFQNEVTKGPEYPDGVEDNNKGDTDLTLITTTLIRSKHGRTGLVMQIVASQSKGVLPALTEFHYIKVNDRFGLEGSLQNYYCVLLPDVTLSRTKIYSKLKENNKLCTAVRICADMLQMFMLWKNINKELICTPKELYEGLIALGYDWDTLLETRSWWTFDNDKHPIPFLTTMDLLRMRIGFYIPYWMEEPPAKALELYNSKNKKPWKFKTPIKTPDK